MIKILLKHFIYEQCINVLFDAFIRNFSQVKHERRMLRKQWCAPTFITADIVSVQPMTEPQGIYFALRYLYGERKEDTCCFS